MSRTHDHYREPPTKAKCKQAWLQAELLWYELAPEDLGPLNGTQVSKEPKDGLKHTTEGLN